MTSPAYISSSQYELMAEHGVFDGKHKQHVELFYGVICDKGTSHPAKISMEQYEMMVELGVFAGEHHQRVELIEGELRAMNPIGNRHAILVDHLAEWSFRTLPPGEAIVRIQNPVRCPNSNSLPQPDLAWVLRKRYAKHPGPEEVLLILEVADTSHPFDRGKKAAIYAAAAFPEYWLVDIATESIEVFRKPAGQRYDEVRLYRGDDSINPLAFPDIVFTPNQLFSDL